LRLGSDFGFGHQASADLPAELDRELGVELGRRHDQQYEAVFLGGVEHKVDARARPRGSNDRYAGNAQRLAGLQRLYVLFETDERRQAPRQRTPDRYEIYERSERGLHLEIGAEPNEAENAAPSQQLSGSPAQQRQLACIKPRVGGWHRRL